MQMTQPYLPVHKKESGFFFKDLVKERARYNMYINAQKQWCSGAGTRRNAVPVNIFLPERRSGRNLLSQPER